MDFTFDASSVIPLDLDLFDLSVFLLKFSAFCLVFWLTKDPFYAFKDKEESTRILSMHEMRIKSAVCSKFMSSLFGFQTTAAI